MTFLHNLSSPKWRKGGSPRLPLIPLNNKAQMQFLALAPFALPILIIFFIFIIILIIIYTAIFFIIGWAAVLALVFVAFGIMFLILKKRRITLILIIIGILIFLLSAVGVLEFGTLDLSLQQIGLG